MSFTEDELQAFNAILERRLSAHRHDMEQTLDRRMNALRRDLEQRLATAQQEILRALASQLSSQQNGLNTILNQKFDLQRKQVGQVVSQQAEGNQQQIEELMDRVQAAQLLGIEQLISQHFTLRSHDEVVADAGGKEHLSPPHIEAIEVQTDLPWEDLVEVFGKVLDTRLVAFNESLSVQLRNLYERVQAHSGDAATATNTHEVLRGIEQLEHIIESMQVVMTTNHALLSNRLYHHQQLPLERAHQSTHTHAPSVNGVGDPLSLPGERSEH
jgi:hypothetical protein